MRPLTVLLAAGLLVGACSDDSDDTAGPSDEAAELLESEGYLDDDGAISIGPAGPSDDDVRSAMCDYLFGDAETMSDRLGVEVTLAEDSGYRNLGGNGTGVSCVYEDGDDPFFGIGLWSRDRSEDADSETELVTVEVPNGDFGFAQYHPDYEGETVDDDDQIAWLEDAGSRWDGQSV